MYTITCYTGRAHVFRRFGLCFMSDHTTTYKVSNRASVAYHQVRLMNRILR